MFRTVLFSTLFALTACSPETAEPADDGQDPPTADDFDVVDQLREHLTGAFDSSAQAEQDPSYFDVHLSGCVVEAPEVGDVALYIEQALSDSLDEPYRQRLYVLEALEDDPDGRPRARSVVWSFVDPEPMVGTCGTGDVEVTASEIEIRTGCAVEVTWLDGHFEGSTVDDACESDLYGASYATSEVVLYPDRIESWDRGWFDDDSQAWGATTGAYVFDRID